MPARDTREFCELSKDSAPSPMPTIGLVFWKQPACRG
jgi:hypothetical protein